MLPLDVLPSQNRPCGRSYGRKIRLQQCPASLPFQRSRNDTNYPFRPSRLGYVLGQRYVTVRAGDMRRTRYIGLARTHLQQILMAVGISLVRVVAWLADPAPAPKRQAHFAT